MNSVRFSKPIGKPAFHFLAFIAMMGTAAVMPVSSVSGARAANSVPHPDHVVIVIEENHSYNQIIGNSCCTYINGLAKAVALMANSHGIAHPSQPNYLDLFSGSNQGVTTGSCPHSFRSANLGQE